MGDFIKDWWPLVAWLLGITTAIVIWGIRLESRQRAQADTVREHYATKAELAAVAAVEPQLQDMKRLVERMDRKLDTLIMSGRGNGRIEHTGP